VGMARCEGSSMGDVQKHGCLLMSGGNGGLVFTASGCHRLAPPLPSSSCPPSHLLEGSHHHLQSDCNPPPLACLQGAAAAAAISVHSMGARNNCEYARIASAGVQHLAAVLKTVHGAQRQ